MKRRGAGGRRPRKVGGFTLLQMADQRRGSVAIAYTTEDDRHAAVQHAREHGCTLIVYAADAASAWSEPMPNQWASEGEDRQVGDRLTPDDLEFLGRNPLAIQVREATAGGVEAFGGLPRTTGSGRSRTTRGLRAHTGSSCPASSRRSTS